jgi:small acid-soluble spore protein (thioredoxin-like protein)
MIHSLEIVRNDVYRYKKERCPMAKPDNREDNAVHLQEHIDHTVENLHEAEDYLDEHADEITAEEKQSIEAKNERREESIGAFVQEKRDESRQ